MKARCVCDSRPVARAWLSVTVELLGGRGEELWPWPGRVFAVGPSQTFQDFADAINGAFARWDRSHLSMFTLSDGRIVTDRETGAEMATSVGGPVVKAVDIATARVARTVELGAEFQFTFDLGDDWTHRCVVAREKIDPLDLFGDRPDYPVPYWGWGSIPDQYGRRWADDDGRDNPPRRPTQPHPMLRQEWPLQERLGAVDLEELRAAIAAHDWGQFVTALSGADIDDALHQVGTGITVLLDHGGEVVEQVVASVINRLTRRGWIGDDVLAEDLLVRLRGEALAGRRVPVDLEMLTSEMEGDLNLSSGGYLDLDTGEVVDEAVTDPMMVGEDVAVDVDEDPDRWLRFDRTGSRDGWQDMAAFAARQHDAELRERLQQAIEGKGAFRRFRDLVHDQNLADSWYVFSADRQLGRARAYLADEGIRLGHQLS